MTILLLCNIGNRDVQLDDAVELPPEVRKSPGNMLIPRLAGEHLNQPDVLKTVLEHIRMPMVEKALQHVIAQHSPQTMEHISLVLFATDQPEDVEAHYRNNDTVAFARLIQSVLVQRHQKDGLVKKRVYIKTTSSNPADYDLMHDFYLQELPRIRQHSSANDDTAVYLLLAGGTPAMNTMLLFAGSEVFGVQAHPLYVSEKQTHAFTLDIVRQLHAAALKRNLTILLHAAAYAPARELLAQSPRVLDDKTHAILDALLRYAEQRRTFRWNEAAATLDTAQRDARNLRAPILRLQQDVAEPGDHAFLRETIFLAQHAVEVEHWLDFLLRLYRFHEGCLQLMAEAVGVEWSANDRASYKERWWNANRAAFSEATQHEVENRRREVNRTSMRMVVAELAEQQARDDLRAALAALEVVAKPLSLRNRVEHGYTPFSRGEIEQHAGVTCDHLLEQMRTAYQHAFQATLPATHPYADINALCARLLEGEL